MNMSTRKEFVLISNLDTIGGLRTMLYTFKKLYFLDWNTDWMPGPYPNTPEEKTAAAKRYGMRPEDYEPYPDDGLGYGDYPMFPAKGVTERDPYEVYDVPTMRRNYGEPVSIDKVGRLCIHRQ
jgi:NADH dehydrogenase (ubiquinone) 1 beta subcomplex subunit 8